MVTTDDQVSWHLDKKVPIAIIITLTLQFIGLVVWGTSAASRLDIRLNLVESWIETNNKLDTRIAVLEATQGFIQDKLSDVKDIVLRIEERVTDTEKKGAGAR